MDSDRELLQQTTRRFLESEFPIPRVRDLAEDNTKFDRELWRQGAELGWTAMLVPESLGGGSVTDAPLLDLCAVAEEMGRMVQPWPWLAANVVAFALAESGSTDHAAVLAGIASGDTVATWALVDADRGWQGGATTLEAGRQGDRYTLRGAKVCVEDADVADHLLVAGHDGTGPMQFLLPRATPGLTVTPMRSLDFARRLFRVDFDDVDAPATSVIGAPGAAGDAIDRQLQLAFVLQCAESVGGADRLCELTFQYAQDRFAFGRPIGSFQAVKHMCADMALLREGSRATTAAAATALQGSPDAPVQASIASAYVGAAFSKIARDAIQVHGGIGYTWEHDAHLYLRRAKSNELLYGDATWHRERLCQLAAV